MSWLLYAHPLAMLAVLGLALLVLREGLRIRRGRLLGRPVSSLRHRRWGRWAVLFVPLGLVSGIATMAWRGEPLLESVHFRLATGAVIGLCSGGGLGLLLERGAGPALRGLHALSGTTGLLLGLAAAMAGWEILP